uniref:Uncharacterized protein n=1 Tax=Panagrolaimus davidi TaxID=227884 RepID=A0A914QAL1_9BILA
MSAAGYIPNSTHIWAKNGKDFKYLGLPNGSSTKGDPTISMIEENAERVFKLVKSKLKNMVIVNSALIPFEMIQACVKVAEKYSDNVMVIPALLARITYALDFLAKSENFPKNEVIFVVTITEAFCEFVILQRNSNFQLFIAVCENYELKKCNEMFEKFYTKHHPTATVFVFHDKFEKIAAQLQQKFKLGKCFMRPFKKYEYILLYGGMLRAIDDDDRFNSKYHIANFSHGFETTILKTKKRHILLPDRSSLPCKIYGFDGESQKIKVMMNCPQSLVSAAYPFRFTGILYSNECDTILSYFEQFHYKYDEYTFSKRNSTQKPLSISGISKEIIGYIDERGVPYAPPPKYIIENEKVKPINISTVKKNDTNAIGNFSKSIPYSSSQSSSTVNSFQSSLSINTFPTSAPSPRHIKFVFRDNFYAVEVFRNGITRVLANSFGKEWTPLYFSFASGTPEFGEVAKFHFEKFPKHVIYDLWEVIGKPMFEIKINPKWGFKLIVDSGIVYFQIETPSGPRLFSQEIVIAAFLKNMKIRVESNLDAKIDEISISTNFKLNESQKSIFKKAAVKNDLEILSFVVVDDL